MAARPFHLAWFLQGSSVQAWGEPWTGHIGQSWMVPELFVDMARNLERACFDYLLIEGSSYVGESYGGSTEVYLANGNAVPRQDPSVQLPPTSWRYSTGWTSSTSRWNIRGSSRWRRAGSGTTRSRACTART